MPQALPSEADRSALWPMLVKVMPWSISALLHLSLLLVSFCLIWGTHDTPRESPIIPVAQFGLKSPSKLILQSPDAHALTQQPLPATPTQSLQMPTSVQDPLKIQPSALGSSELELGSSLTPAPGPAPGSIPGNFSSKTSGGISGETSGGGGGGNPFGSAVWSGPVLKASFYGNTGNARDIVYLVDASASLVDVLPFILKELKRSIHELNDQQQFAVIFFQADETIEVPPLGLKTANPQNKQRLSRWIEEKHLDPKGLSNPLHAVKQGLAYKPHLMFILSDNITGSGIEPRRLLSEISKANSAATRINTIQFLYPDKLEQSNLKPTLKAIAELTGGIYKFLDSRELGIH